MRRKSSKPSTNLAVAADHVQEHLGLAIALENTRDVLEREEGRVQLVRVRDCPRCQPRDLVAGLGQRNRGLSGSNLARGSGGGSLDVRGDIGGRVEGLVRGVLHLRYGVRL